ncbi:MAG: cyclase [Cyanothece sp. SIO1E1]|nr:cyclase [Cyanothece sp. SIO1E1]
MVLTHASNLSERALDVDWDGTNQAALLSGEVLVKTKPHSSCGGAVTARIYLPMTRSLVWQKLTNYSRWAYYFPDLVHSELLARGDGSSNSAKRLYQVGRKAFLIFTAQVEIYLKVFETLHQSIQFRFERGSFNDFSADLKLQDCGDGTVLSYSVQAIPTIPVPSAFIQQAMHIDLPNNLRQLRKVISGM